MRFNSSELTERIYRKAYTSKHWEKNYGRTISVYRLEGSPDDLDGDLYYVAGYNEIICEKDAIMRKCPDEWYLLSAEGKWMQVGKWREVFLKQEAR